MQLLAKLSQFLFFPVLFGINKVKSYCFLDLYMDRT